MKSSARPHRRSASLDEGDLFASTSASASGGFVTAPILRHEPIERSPAPLASFLEQQQRQLYAEAPQPGDDALDESDDEASGSDDDDDEEGSSGESSSFDSDFMPTIATSARPRGGSLSAVPAQRARGMSGAFSYDDDDVADMNAREQELLVNIQELQRQLSMVQIQTEKPQEEIVPPTRDARRRLIMVSNRLPISFQRNETTGEWEFKMSSGGLVTALNGIRDEVPFIWIGWLGQEIAQEDQNKVREKLAKEFNCVPVFLSKEIASRYYNDFSNDILWPTFHYVPLPLFRAGSEKKFDFRLWDAYKLANKRFAQAVNQVYRDGDYVWIHDYHLMNLPTLLRKRHPKCKIGWFLHTPFPSSEMYRSLPVGKQILEGLLGADLLGFHTYDYARHFLSACGRIPGATSSPKGIEWEGHFSAVGVFPIGIDPEHFENILAKNETQQRIKELTEKFKGCKVIIGVDRMDYIKGIPHKLLAMERYLAKYPERRENVILVQIGVPSRTDVVEYQNLAASVNEMVGRINGRYGTLQHSPVHYIHRPIPPSELVALYNIADACLVTSLRDGMNLVSHEFVMCQSQPCAPHRDGPGVLVLSEFAGSAQSLSGAIRVNPWNTDDIATALEYAFTLPLMEREYRQSNLHRYVKTHTASFWGKSFLADLEYTTASRPPAARKLVKLPTMDVMTAYARSKRRMIVLDYEGTLLEEAHQRATPAPPKPFIKRIIESLANDKKNTVLLVSGHERGVIGSWLNDRRIGVVAESGYYYRLPYTDDWEMMTEDHDPSWKKVVRPIMQYFTERTPGSSIETKESSLTWHYGETDPIFGPMQARDMQVNLEDVLCSLPLEVQQGTNNVEVRLQGISKTVLIDEILKLYQQQTQQTQALPPVASGSGATGRKARSTPSPIDFVFCAGNGLEDDDIFTFFQEHHDQSKVQATTTNTKTKTKTSDPTTTSTTNTNTSTNATGDTTSVSGTTTTSLLAGTSLPPGVARPPTPTRPPTPAPAPAPAPASTPTVETRSPLKGSSALAKNANVYTCHIGANKTEAMYYLERPSDLVRVLRSLAAQSREGFAAHESPDVDLIGSSSPPVNSGESAAAPVSPP